MTRPAIRIVGSLIVAGWIAFIAWLAWWAAGKM